MNRYSKPVLFLLAILALAFSGCSRKDANAATSTTTAPQPQLPADVQKVAGASTATSESAATTDTATAGQTGAPTAASVASEAAGAVVATGEFVAPVRSELAAKMPGRVGKVYVDEGSRVTKGQPLLELETDYVRLNLERAEADVARAKAAEDDARRDFDRKKDLIAKDSIPKATYDRSEGAYQQAEAARASAAASASLLRQQLGDAVLRSPINGVVAERRTDVGQRLADNSVAFVVVQTAPLKLRFRVPERYLASVARGQRVSATVDPYPGEKFDGRVTVVGGVIDPATRSMVVETEFPNSDGRLRPGLFARVELQPNGK
jgi:membrane fusion protein (multidrug efflux system)